MFLCSKDLTKRTVIVPDDISSEINQFVFNVNKSTLVGVFVNIHKKQLVENVLIF